jgi:hypothetical protein
MRDWNIYTRAQENIERSGRKTLEKLDAAVEAADLEQTKSKIGVFYDSSKPSAATEAAYTKAVQARDNFRRDQVQKELNLAISAPDFPGKKSVVDNLVTELELYPKPVKPLSVAEAEKKRDAEDKPAPTTPNKPVPSNKVQGTKAMPMATPKSAAEAVDGKYYTTNKGVLKWDAKSQSFVE